MSDSLRVGTGTRIAFVVAFLIIAVVGILPSMVVDGFSAGLLDMKAGDVANRIEMSFQYLGSNAPAVEGMVRTWMLCSLAAIALAVLEAVLSIALRGTEMLVMAGLGVFANTAAKAIFTMSVMRGNANITGDEDADFLSLAHPSLEIWVALHVVVIGLIIWQLVVLRGRNRRKMTFMNMKEEIDETMRRDVIR